VGVDWTELRRRVEAAGAATAGGGAATTDQMRALLEDRARALARPVAVSRPTEALQLISFRVAGETYALDSRYVLELCRLGELTPLPQAEPWVAGLTAWRGELLLIADLRVLVGLPAAPRAERPGAVVLGRDGPVLGILTDAPGEVLSIPVADLRPPPESIPEQDYVRGITTEAVLVLQVDQVLRVAESEAARGR
jgi:purine-binding chemotaxis protein CheW